MTQQSRKRLFGGAAIIVVLSFAAIAFASAFAQRMVGDYFDEREVEHLGAKRIIAIVPHPDDEAFGFSGALAQSILDGAEVRLYLMSDGPGSKEGPKWIEAHQALSNDFNSDGCVNVKDFTIKRRAELIASAQAIGIPEGNLVFMDDVKPTLNRQDIQQVARFIVADCEGHGFSLDKDTAVVTVAPDFGRDAKARFFSEDYKGKWGHVVHQECSFAAIELSREHGVSPDKVYFFKIYGFSGARTPLLAPMVFVPSEEAAAARRASIEAYSEIGKPSALGIYKGALRSSREYGSTYQDLREAGYEY